MTHDPPGSPSQTVATDSRCFALVPCAGVGARSGAAGPKQYVPIAGRAMVLWTLDALARVPAIACTLVVVAPDDAALGAMLEGEAHVHGRLEVVAGGGATRAHSVANGLAFLSRLGARDDDWVLVHDAARCLVDPAAIERLIAACRDDDVGGLLALPIADTLKHATPDDRVDATLDRTAKWAAQTPQMFRLGLLRRALAQAADTGAPVTDEASAIEALGLAPRLVRGALDNFKITWPEDFALAERLLHDRDPAHDPERHRPLPEPVVAPPETRTA
jgi:2-C-methyl-D-erythritol 4-phosphate cytidylyltransferase